MKILLDARKWNDGGIGVMIQMLARYLTQDGIKVATIVRQKDENLVYRITKIEPIVTNVSTYSIKELFEIGRIANQSDADVLYIPHYTVPFACKKPIVSIIHDTIQIQFPDQFSVIQRFYAQWMIWWALYRSEIVVTQSNTVKEDLFQRFPKITKEKIFPILRIPDYSWYDPFETHSNFDLPSEYCLYYGAYRKHKNLSFLINLWYKHPDLPPLVLAGDQLEKYPDLQQNIYTYIPKRCLDLGVLNFNDLRALVRNAFCVLLPSKYEGFGATPLEAMMMGVPAIVSDRGALPESAGSGAIILSLENENAWYEAICSLKNEEIRNQQIAKGQLWLKKFDENQWLESHKKICQLAIERFAKR